MKFQNISIHGSKVMLCTRKRDERTKERTYKPEAKWPPTFFKDHNLQYRPGPPAEFRRVSMRCLSHWSGQQQHLLQWLQALGAVGSSA